VGSEQCGVGGGARGSLRSTGWRQANLRGGVAGTNESDSMPFGGVIAPKGGSEVGLEQREVVYARRELRSRLASQHWFEAGEPARWRGWHGSGLRRLDVLLSSRGDQIDFPCTLVAVLLCV
jgi:hypothetical protein